MFAEEHSSASPYHDPNALVKARPTSIPPNLDFGLGQREDLRSKMKILLASFLYETEIGGGAAVVVNQLAQMLVRQNHDVTVLTTWSGAKVKAEVVDDVRVFRLPASNLYWVADKDRQPQYKKVIWQLVDIWNPTIYRLARDILGRESPDIVHSHKLRGLSPAIWSAANAAGVRTIVHTCHDYELLSPEGFFMGWAGKLARERHLVLRPYQAWRRRLSRLVHDVTAPSRYVLDQHGRMGFFPKARTRVVPNSHGFDAAGVRKNFSDAASSHTEVAARRFLYLGRLDKAKGIDLLCQAFSRVADREPGLLLRITGWGPLGETLRKKYERQTNIVFTGPLFGAQKTDLFKNTDVLVAPSVSPESFGIVVTEAYAHGVPVITSRAGAFPEIVRDGETGLLADTGSVDDLVAVLAKVSKERSLVASMSANCFAEAQKYTTERLLGDYLAVYRDNPR